jgi:transcriptional regulator with XRE-family HTH domain
MQETITCALEPAAVGIAARTVRESLGVTDATAAVHAFEHGQHDLRPAALSKLWRGLGYDLRLLLTNERGASVAIYTPGCIAQEAKYARLWARMSHADVAARLGVPTRAAYAFERGDTPPSMSAIRRYFEAIGYEVRLELHHNWRYEVIRYRTYTVTCVKHDERRNGARTAAYWSVSDDVRPLADAVYTHWGHARLPKRIKEVLEQAPEDPTRYGLQRCTCTMVAKARPKYGRVDTADVVSMVLL